MTKKDVLVTKWSFLRQGLHLQNYKPTAKYWHACPRLQTVTCEPKKLFCIILFLAPVVQKLHYAIYQISCYPVDNKTKPPIHWMVIYPVDSVIHLPNNLSLMI